MTMTPFAALTRLAAAAKRAADQARSADGHRPRTVFPFAPTLRATTHGCIREHNRGPNPSAWTTSTDLVLAILRGLLGAFGHVGMRWLSCHGARGFAIRNRERALSTNL